MAVASECVKLGLINSGLPHNSSINFRSGRKNVEVLFSRNVKEDVCSIVLLTSWDWIIKVIKVTWKNSSVQFMSLTQDVIYWVLALIYDKTYSTIVLIFVVLHSVVCTLWFRVHIGYFLGKCKAFQVDSSPIHCYSGWLFLFLLEQWWGQFI